MVYEVGFRHEGMNYYLSGKEEIRNDLGFEAWKDTTTLFANQFGLKLGSDRTNYLKFYQNHLKNRPFWALEALFWGQNHRFKERLIDPTRKKTFSSVE